MHLLLVAMLLLLVLALLVDSLLDLESNSCLKFREGRPGIARCSEYVLRHVGTISFTIIYHTMYRVDLSMLGSQKVPKSTVLLLARAVPCAAALVFRMGEECCDAWNLCVVQVEENTLGGGVRPQETGKKQGGARGLRRSLSFFFT